MSEQRRAVVLLVLASMLWSFGGLLIKWVDWDPLAIAGARSGFAALLTLAVVHRRNFTWSGPQLGAAVCFAITSICFVLATKWTTAANAILLLYTAPVYIILFAPWFLGERPRWFDWMIVAAVLAGMALFFLDRLTTRQVWGNVLGVITGLATGWMMLLMRKQKSGSPFESVFMGNVLTLVVCVPFMFGRAPSATSLMGVGVLGVFQLGLPYVCYAAAIRHVTALEGALIPAMEPILNPLLVLLVLGEQPGAWAIPGGAIVLTAVVVRAALTARRGRVIVPI